MVQLWQQTLNLIGEARFDEAFRKVLNESKFRPDIAEIRAAAGVTDESDSRAMADFLHVIAVIRKHTVNLKPTGDVIIKDRGDDGRLLEVPIRSPKVPFPGFSAHTEETLERMGWGDARKGLLVVAEHPAVASEHEAGGWMLKTAEQIETRWKQCWKGGK